MFYLVLRYRLHAIRVPVRPTDFFPSKNRKVSQAVEKTNEKFGVDTVPQRNIIEVTERKQRVIDVSQSLNLRAADNLPFNGVLDK